MLKQRIITGLVLAASALGAVFWLPPLIFSLLIGIVIVLAAWEWASLAGYQHVIARVAYAAFLGGLCFLVDAYHFPPLYLLIAAFFWWCLAFMMIRAYPVLTHWLSGNFIKLLMGIITLLPAWVAIVTLKNNFSPFSIMLILLFVWAADVGAYFVGKQFGRHKLAEQVSPKKTVEGMVGGIVFAVAVAIITGLLLDFSFGKGLGLMTLSVVTALVSVIGDLLESLLKRERGVKDSSDLLPGHGGVLDRIDSLSAALPVFTLFLMIAGG
ncbi:MAG: phosphatidate cytidylyltransferase [Endozoicomonas sp. (ex Botrylloides leachii)]|nr:phosphatidate cytidylyltransferase [Endozoicomonas sp. (ex Botrylloides leachii)]